MCGIFGFILNKSLHLNKPLQVLQKLEVSKYANERTPVGGYGAGIAVLLDDNTILSEKVGKTSDSPACQLAEIVKPKLSEVRVLIGHVRFPGSEFLDTVKFKEATQPFVETFDPDVTFVSAHNGRIENYAELRKKLRGHVFESEKTKLIDSEVIPHYFGSLLQEIEDVNQAVNEMICALQGGAVGSISLLHLDDENAYLHLIHKGWSRGLTIWANDKDEMIFCTRPEPVMAELGETLSKGKFTEKAVVKPREDATLKFSFPIVLK